MKNSHIKEKLKNMNLQYTHPSYYLEKKLLNQIKMGINTDVKSTLDEINALQKASLARNSLRSIKNSLIASCTIFTRAAIESGVNPEDAFDQSDVLIKEIELFENEILLAQFEYVMANSFIELIKSARLNQYNYPISSVIHIIYENLTNKLSITDIAETVNFSPDYLSKLFHKEVGHTINDYIHLKKIETSLYFLEYTDLKVTEIATILEYSNPGHFTNTFKKIMECTPHEYRKNTHL